jgi:DNA-3-methyladenine glycosylase II
MGQQLSVKAAATIRARVQSIVPSFNPEGFLEVRPEALRQAGLSGAKTKSVRELAQRTTDGRLDFSELAILPDEEAIAVLTTVPGIGRWTAQMFLISGLSRPNVLALGDAGLRRAARVLFGEQASLETLRELWEPYCSVASWYLWRHLDATQGAGA